VELLRHRAQFLNDQLAFTFLVDGEGEALHLSYGELDRRARAIAASLQERRMAGERALLLYPPGLDFVTGFFGCLYAGVVAVTAYPPRMNRSLGRIRSIVADAGAKIAMTTQPVLERISPWIGEDAELARLEWLTTEDTATGIEERWQPPEIDRQTLAFLQYTSGSTGTPKGVMLSHQNLLHNCSLIHYGFEHSRSSSGVFWLPSYHDMGLVGGILQPLYVGTSNVLMSPMAFLQKPIRWLRAISKYRATTSGGPNFAYDLCLRKVTPEQRDELDLSSWTVAFNGAEPVRDETLERFAQYFAPCGFRAESFYPCYGLAEATLIASGGRARQVPTTQVFDARRLEHGRALHATSHSPHARRLVSCGTSLPDQVIAIVDPERRTRCDDREVGEIWLSGPSVAKGYWRRLEETEHTFQARIADTGEGPFLRTGDLGFLDQGELYVTGRIKDLIIVRGVNHYPQDIELTVEHCHPALRPNAGAAFSFEQEGRSGLAVVQEVERGHQGDAGRLIEAIRVAVAREHELQLDAIVLVRAGSVPKTSSGKIQRHACRKGFLEQQLKVVAQWPPPPGARSEGDEIETLTASAAMPALASVSGQNGCHPSTSTRYTSNGSHGHLANGNGKTVPAAHGTGHAMTNGAAGHGLEVGERSASHSGNKTLRKDGPAATRSETSTAAIATAVMDMIRSTAIDRAVNLNLDTSLSQLGLDSLQRIELQAMIEEHYGGRLPEDVGPQLETVREIVAAVEQYIINAHDREQAKPSLADVPPESYRFELYPEYLKLRQTIDLMEAAGAENPYFRPHERITSDRAVIGGREFINFCSYNYLGMTAEPIVQRAAKDAIDRYGTSCSASRLVSGEKVLHRELEAALAEFTGTEDAIGFVGGHATNVNTIGHLFGPGDLILHDALAHNSIVQGCILSGAKRRPFPHNDWRALDRLLTDLRPRYRRVLIAIEGAYSMDGDIAELPRFVELKKRHKCFLMVDEAHSAGVLGRRGRGVAEHFDVHPREVDIWMGTLSKAWGSVGGYICGSRELVEYLKYTAPGFVFSVAISPPDAASALASLRLLEAEPERVARLQARSRLFLQLARSRGLNTGLSNGTPIVPIIIGDSLHCLQLSRALYERGINVQPILYPAVEESAARLRFFITAAHSEEQIRYTVDALAEEAERLDPRYVSRRPMVPNAADFAAGIGALNVMD
jgi:8-amino-7-oxononanoate synthase